MTTKELDELANSEAGAFVTKTATRDYREGNPEPRYYDTALGSINSMGLPNNGLDYYLDYVIDKIKYDIKYGLNSFPKRVKIWIESDLDDCKYESVENDYKLINFEDTISADQLINSKKFIDFIDYVNKDN